MALRLSWYMTASSNSNPCPWIRDLNHRNTGRTSSAPISSAYVEIIEFRFCLLDILATDTHHRDIVDPAWLWKYGCIAYDVSTHHFTMFRLYTLNINDMWMVDMMYYSTHCSFCQSSLSKILTLVMRNVTAIYKFLLTKVVENNSFWLSDGMKWPDLFPTVSYCSLPSIWLYALLLGLSISPFIFPGKSDTIFFRKSVIFTPTYPSTEKSRSILR